MQVIAALPCATASQFSHDLLKGGGVARSRSTALRFGNVRKGRVVVVSSKQPDVEKEREQLSGFEMPTREGIKEKKLAAPSEAGQGFDEVRRVERMFSNLNEVSLKHEPGKMSSLVL